MDQGNIKKDFKDYIVQFGIGTLVVIMIATVNITWKVSSATTTALIKVETLENDLEEIKTSNKALKQSYDTQLLTITVMLQEQKTIKSTTEKITERLENL